MKSSLSIWRLLTKCQIDGEDFIIFVVFLENMDFTCMVYYVDSKYLVSNISNFFEFW